MAPQRALISRRSRGLNSVHPPGIRPHVNDTARATCLNLVELVPSHGKEELWVSQHMQLLLQRHDPIHQRSPQPFHANDILGLKRVFCAWSSSIAISHGPTTEVASAVKKSALCCKALIAWRSQVRANMESRLHRSLDDYLQRLYARCGAVASRRLVCAEGAASKISVLIPAQASKVWQHNREGLRCGCPCCKRAFEEKLTTLSLRFARNAERRRLLQSVLLHWRLCLDALACAQWSFTSDLPICCCAGSFEEMPWPAVPSTRTIGTGIRNLVITCATQTGEESETSATHCASVSTPMQASPDMRTAWTSKRRLVRSRYVQVESHTADDAPSCHYCARAGEALNFLLRRSCFATVAARDAGSQLRLAKKQLRVFGKEFRCLVEFIQVPAER